jgi:hypothetical protein
VANKTGGPVGPRRHPLMAIGALRLSIALAACAACSEALAAPGNGWRDVFDTPAMKSPLAERNLLNGLARAGTRPRCRSVRTWLRCPSPTRPTAGRSATTASC